MKAFTSDKLKDFGFSSSLEWLETNGLGGYASSTVSGAHTRRYHGLLVASKRPPVERAVVLSKLDETIVTKAGPKDLGTNQYPGVIHPKGFSLIKSFQRSLFPQFTYQVGEITISKTVAAIHDENTTVVVYEVLAAKNPFAMEFIPMCSARDFHSTTHANEGIYQGYMFENSIFRTKNYEDSPELFISIPRSEFRETKTWYRNLEFPAEQARGLDYVEDLFNHGVFQVELKKGDKVGVIISTVDPSGKDAIRMLEAEKARREKQLDNLPADSDLGRLVLAADQFIVRRGKDLRTIIAGYHWFSDWGRDTMIALPGLCLSTGRFQDARKILEAFASSASDGLLPNRFSDYGESPSYNTADATLWFFVALRKYQAVTGDEKYVRSLIPLLRDLIDWHYKGTRYNIHVDKDELLYAGEEGVQLTWMDAKVGNWVVTPRSGKTVEVNALWYNALSIMAALYSEAGNTTESADFRKRAERARESFEEVFWNKSREALCDLVDGDVRNEDLRPNQLYAISLPYKLLDQRKAAKVFAAVSRKLLTPRGLRSLSSDHKDYKPFYSGDTWHRDAAYHQGTVWSFLLGPYIDALMYVKGEKGRVEASRIMKTALSHLDEAGLGSVSEIFDGASPHKPGGCIAQAWGVGEWLRVIKEYELFPKGNPA